LNDLAKNIILWIVIAVVLLTVFQSFGTGARQSTALDYSAFLELTDTGQVKNVMFEGEAIRGELVSGERFVTYSPETDNTVLIGELRENNVQIKAMAPRARTSWSACS